VSVQRFKEFLIFRYICPLYSPLLKIAKRVVETCSRYKVCIVCFHIRMCICCFDVSNYSIRDYELLKIDCVLAFPFALPAGHGTPTAGS